MSIVRGPGRDGRWTSALVLVSTIMALGGCGSDSGHDQGTVHWSLDGDPPTAVNITGGPWTLTQLAAGNSNPPKVPNPSYGYTANFGSANSGKTSPMQPYYFGFTRRSGDTLQGYFDWRPKEINEAIVAANSTDGGKTWQFQQIALVLTNAVPLSPQSTNPDSNLADDGFGHPAVLRIVDPDPLPTPTVGGEPPLPTPTAVQGALPDTFLYTLDRSTDAVHRLGLVVSALSPTADAPLNGALANIPLVNDFTDESQVVRTQGLKNPDGILAVVPGTTKPVKVLYIQKIGNGDLTGATRLPGSQQCQTQPYTPTAAKAPNPPNHDVVAVRAAVTYDGVNFIDLGQAVGLMDPTTTSYTGTRWVAPGGTMLDLGGGRFGLFFSGGNCMDADSDAFHYIGYAESTDPDLLNWTIINGINNPIASILPHTVPVDGVPTVIPAQTPVVGPTLDPFDSRVYAPSGIVLDSNTLLITFAGYHVQSPNDDLLDYRTIMTVRLKSSRSLLPSG